MPIAPKNRVLLLALTLPAALLLHHFPPETSHFYPLCPFHAMTGLLCPGCGATRALAALTHLHFAEAWHANPLTLLFLPAVLLYVLRPFPIRPPAIAVLLTVTILFGIVRNL